MNQPMSVLTSQSTAEWYTPTELIEPVREFFGGQIYLDPATCVSANARVKALTWFGPDNMIGINRDGMTEPWVASTVFLNPPYQGETAKWISKAKYEFERGNAKEIILLVKSVPGYVWWEKLWREFPVCMLRTRPRFINEAGVQNGEAKQGHCFVYFGPKNRRDDFRSHFAPLGRIILPEGEN